MTAGLSKVHRLVCPARASRISKNSSMPRICTMKTISLFLSVSVSLVLADQAGRKHAENELLARPAVRITVALRNADIIGSDNRALQAAVDYVGNLGGGLVEIGPGEFMMPRQRWPRPQSLSMTATGWLTRLSEFHFPSPKTESR